MFTEGWTASFSHDLRPQVAASAQKGREQAASQFLAACTTGDIDVASRALHDTQPPCVFTGLVLAASKGHKVSGYDVDKSRCL